MGRIFREFSVTIIISIFASGVVSLTLTPLMCARLLAQRGHGTKKTWMERVIGGVEQRVLGVYGDRSGSSFAISVFRPSPGSIVCWARSICSLVPKSFLPVATAASCSA